MGKGITRYCERAANSPLEPAHSNEFLFKKDADNMSASNQEHLNKLKELDSILLPIFGRQIAHFGFTPIPNILLRNRVALKLAPAEWSLLIDLLSRALQESAEFLVYPSVGEIVAQTGYVSTTIHTAKDGLVEKKMMKIPNERNRLRTNFYDLRPCIEKLNRFASDKLAEEGAGEHPALGKKNGELDDVDTAGIQRSTGS
jgi:hypothetical protein